MTKYEYKFVRLDRGFFGFKSLKHNGYQDIIRDEAEDEWHFVQAFAPGMAINGTPPWIDLIFEREVEAGARDGS